MKICGLILVLISCVLAGYAQAATPTPPQMIDTSPKEPCKLKPSALPAVRGLRLDMAKADVQKEYPKMLISADPVKSSGMIMSYQITNAEYQENLDRIVVGFRNDKVFSILYTYGDLVQWDSMQEFADKISKSLNLPKAAERKREGGVYYSVNCGEFVVRTRINSEKRPTLLITKDPDEMWESSQERKDAFKP